MASEFDKNLTVNEKMLQEQALHFVSMVNKLDTEKELFREQALKFIDFQGNPESTNYMKDKEDAFERSINQQKYLLAINFEHYLSIYRKEKERSAIYVTVDSKGHIAGSYEIPMKELITYSLKSGEFSESQINTEGRISIEGSPEEQSLLNARHIEEAQMAYNGVYERLERYYEVAEYKKQEKKKIGGFLLQKNSKGWVEGQVLNYGDLKEAYIAYLFDTHGGNVCKLAGGNPPYYNHAFIGQFFEKYASKVTNLAAIREEDIISNKRKKQYAVKGLGAKLPSFNQYFVIAKYLAYGNYKMIDRKKLEQYIKDRYPSDAKRNKAKAIEEITQAQFKQLRKDFNKSQV